MNVTNIVQLGRPPLPPIKKKNNNRQTATLTQTNLNKPVSYECKDSFPYLFFQQPYQGVTKSRRPSQIILIEITISMKTYHQLFNLIPTTLRTHHQGIF